MVKDFDADLVPKYNKQYIGLSKDGRVNSLIRLKPRKNLLRLIVFLEKSQEIEQQLEQTDLDFEYKKQTYEVQLNKGDIKNHADALKELMRLAYNRKIL